ncbi:MAG: hypothetical protein IJS47_03040 [Clostridia bacterium]|nr:hypothetical protein [Clostridia bacterium]
MTKKINVTFLIGCLIGAIIFVSLYGVSTLNVTYDDWLLASSGDLTCEYIGWLFFRNTPWSFPIGNVEGLIYPCTMSIIMNDSIPLFAIFFKIFNNILPETFQYWGIWELICFMLQGGISAVILNKVTNNKVVSCVGSTFFCISTIMVVRAFLHTALSGGQFIILLSILLWLYKDKFSTLKERCLLWGIISFLCVTVNIYFFPMVFSILCFMLLYEFVNKKVTIKSSVFLIAFVFGITVFFWWFFGGFASKSEVSIANGANNGEYTANLNTFINPRWAWDINTSKFLSMLDYSQVGSYEGYAYLGVGVIVLLILDLVLCITNKTARGNREKWSLKSYLHNESTYIILCGMFLILIASFPQITFGKYVLFRFPVFKIFTYIFSVFFSNGRFLWPVWYVIVIYAIYVISKYCKTYVAIVILIVTLLIQYIDVGGLFRYRIGSDIVYESPLKSSAWEEIAEDKTQIFLMDNFINMGARGRGWHEFTYEIFAYNHGLAINDTYTSKKDEKYIRELKEIEWEELLSGNPDENKIYIFNDIPSYQIVKMGVLNIYEVDDRIIGLVNKLLYYDDVKEIDANRYQAYTFTKDVNFTSNESEKAEGVSIRTSYETEPDGTWTSGDRTNVYFKIDDIGEDIYVNINLVDARPNVLAEIVINDSLKYNIDVKKRGIQSFFIPKELLEQGVVDASFYVKNANSPAELGTGSDTRVLGIKLSSVSLTKNKIEN